MVFRQPEDFQLCHPHAVLHECSLVGLAWEMGRHELLDVCICNNSYGDMGLSALAPNA